MKINNVILTIPVRLESKRFPNKALALFNGKTLIENSINIAKKLNFVDKIVVASGTDDIRIEKICNENDIKYFYMKEEVSCGTERVIYVKDKYPNYKYYMTLPIDEPSINPEELNSFWEKANINMVTNIFTFYSDFYCEEDLLSNNSCKIVMLEDMVLYTSRAVIPASKENKKIKYLSAYKRHIGVFFFSSMVLEYQYSSLWKHREENVMIEGLEQNAFVPWMNAYKIKHIGFGVDMEEDIKKLEERMNG